MSPRMARPWELTYTDWLPDSQPLREALCALGNGWIVTRGAFEEARADGTHYPGTYLAGGYNRLVSEVAGRELENEDLVNWPNWLPLTFRVAGETWFSLDAVELLDFRFRLDLRRGVLERSMRFRDDGAREFTLISRRIVHMATPHLAALEWTLVPHDWSGELEIRSGLDGTVRNENVLRYRALANRHIEVLETDADGDETIVLTARTNQSLVRMTQAARTRVLRDGTAATVRRRTERSPDRVDQIISISCESGQELRIEKVVAIRTSRDVAISETSLAARNDVARAPSFDALLQSHERAWRHLWSGADIELHEGDDEAQMILRLHIFHLLQTVSPNTIDRDVGVPARGWHGEAYRGHIFWDELFIFPFLTLRMPELTRSLLMYRHRRLPEARHAARAEGYRGAMFPWQSGSDGREESQVLHLNPRSGRWVPDTTHLQRHVNAAIAYTIMSYHRATGDIEFLANHGAEMFFEIARFWVSLATYDAPRNRYSIRGVVGPDEFHTDDPRTERPGLDNNAYTNVMASWLLHSAGEVFALLDEETRRQLVETLEITDDEPARWDEVSRRLFVPFHDDCIISQFEGYESLAEFDWDGYRSRYGDIHRLDRILEAEGDDVNLYKASKQADVLMLFYLFSSDELREQFAHMGYEFDPEWIPQNVRYYSERSSHGSTLSYIVHSWILARSDREAGWACFQRALRADIEDIQGGTTPEGIHLGALAGTVDIIQRGFMGLTMHEDVLWFDPVFPSELDDVRLRLHYRGHWLTVRIAGGTLVISCDRARAPTVDIGFRGHIHTMRQGETLELALPAGAF